MGFVPSTLQHLARVFHLPYCCVALLMMLQLCASETSVPPLMNFPHFRECTCVLGRLSVVMAMHSLAHYLQSKRVRRLELTHCANSALIGFIWLPIRCLGQTLLSANNTFPFPAVVPKLGSTEHRLRACKIIFNKLWSYHFKICTKFLTRPLCLKAHVNT